jgi:diacylglycerol O-acyltransferase
VTVLVRTPLGTVDGLWLSVERPGNVMVVDTVVWTATPLDRCRLLDLTRERVWWRYPAFRSRPVRDGAGHWWWLEDPGCEIEDLVEDAELDDPDDPVSLQRLVAATRTEQLPHDRPIWRARFVQRYRGGSAVILRTHHALADGVRMVQIATGLFDSSPDGGAVLPPPGRHFAEPATAPVDGRSPGRGLRHLAANPVGGVHGAVTGLAADAGRLAGTVLADVDAGRKLLLGTRDDATVWTGSATDQKYVGWTDRHSVNGLQRAARAQSSTVNDVVVAGVALGLHRYLSRSGRPPRSVAFMVPVNLVPIDPTLPVSLGNNFALVQLELPTGSASPLETLRTVRRRTMRIKSGHEPVVDLTVERLIAQLGPVVFRAAVALLASRAAGVLTNVPGPPFPVFLAGSKVDGMVGWAPVLGDQPLSFAACSYDGGLVVGVAADCGLVADAARLVGDVDGALSELAEAAVADAAA